MPAHALEPDISRPRPVKRPAGWLTIQLAAAAALVALADFLFYDRRLGISLALFLAALALISACLNPLRAEAARRWHAAILIAAGLLPIVEDINWLSVTIALLATAASARMLTEARPPSWAEQLRSALRLPLSGPFRLFSDFARASRYGRRRQVKSGVLAGLLGWAVPLMLCAVFAALFVSANPLLERWLNAIDIRAILGQLLSGRSLFWAAILCLIWPLVRMRSLRRRKRGDSKPSAKATSGDPLDLLGDLTIKRSLVLFNGLFAIQTAMDLAYLWGGASLPEGLSHASYAHRGAYPLVVTALLAAAFVLLAMRPSGAGARSPLVKLLVLAWVGQNILLMLSALLRLKLYVDAYSLTELRMAAFVWMLLVAGGLVLILIQILSQRPIGWLVSANAVMLALMLYGYSFVDTAVVIANYNIRHSYEMRGTGQRIDFAYLWALGPGIIPAIDRYAPRIAAVGNAPSQVKWGWSQGKVASYRDGLAGRHRAAQIDWRAWSFRDWRLSRYLASVPQAPFKAILPSPSGTPEEK